MERAIPYLYSVGMKLESLARLERLQPAWGVPAHHPPCRNLGPLITANRAAIEETLEMVRRAVRGRAADAAEILQAVCRQKGVSPSKITDFLLLQPTVYSYISYLHNRGELQFRLEDGRLLWFLPS